MQALHFFCIFSGAAVLIVAVVRKSLALRFFCVGAGIFALLSGIDGLFRAKLPEWTAAILTWLALIAMFGGLFVEALRERKTKNLSTHVETEPDSAPQAAKNCDLG